MARLQDQYKRMSVSMRQSNDKNILNREKIYWDSKEIFEWLSERGINSVLEEMPSIQGDVLGLCSGSGMFPKRIPVKYDRYVSLDLSQSLLEQQWHEIPWIMPVVGNAENSTFVSSSFDLVLVFAGLHHLVNLYKTIQNGYRVLRPGGKFIAFEPNASCWYRKPMLHFKNVLKLYTEDEKFLYPEHVKEIMSRIGFRDIKLKFLTPEYNPVHLQSLLNQMLSQLMMIAARINRGRYWQSFFIIQGKK